MYRTIPALLLLLFSLALSSTPAHANLFTVNDLGDGSDTNPGDGICNVNSGTPVKCTLRAAIQEANAYPGDDSIIFSVSGTISVSSVLPDITEHLTIEGSDLSGPPEIELDGSSVSDSDADGLTIRSDVTDVIGLSIVNFPDNGISIPGNQNGVVACYLGIELDGTSAGNGSSGIDVTGNDNVIGVPGYGRNVISANGTGDSAFLSGVTVIGGSGNQIQNNYIGTDTTGTKRRGNDVSGIYLGSTVTGTLIGGSSSDARNVISGNAVGIQLAGSDNNTIQGNYVGPTVTGNAEAHNVVGILLFGGATNNTVGGTSSGEGNLISGNTGIGVHLSDTGTGDNTVKGNIIGLDGSGTAALANELGVQIDEGASNNVIGGTTSGELNTISGNTADGIRVSGSGTKGNEIVSNLIGPSTSGGPGVGNGDHGINVRNGAGPFTIGGTTTDSMNVIGDNGHVGINLHSSTSDIDVVGNRIGTGVAEGDLSNVQGGVFVNGTDHTIADNVVGYSPWGIRLGGEAQSSVVRGNYVGEAPDGTDIGHTFAGIRLSPNSTSAPVKNVVGAPKSGSVGSDVANVVANNDVGITVEVFSGEYPLSNSIRGNEIYGNSGLGIDLADDGITANDGADSDDGPHHLQNTPVIRSAGYDAGTDQVTVEYLVPSDPSLTGSGASTYDLTIDFYRADADNQEGAVHLGTDTYSSTDYSSCGTPPCEVTTTFAPRASVSESDHVLATATDAAGNTSEFSVSSPELPVELAAFRAVVSSTEAVTLSWRTTSETNNARFEVQRRMVPPRGQTNAGAQPNDNPTWETVGTLQGAGTTHETHSYELRDRELPFETKRLVYRLLQHDANGTGEVVADRTVEIPTPESVALRPPVPNPVRDRATIRYTLPDARSVNIAVFDGLGRRVKTLVQSRQQGRNTLAVDATTLSSGVYFIRLTAGPTTKTKKMLVLDE